MFDHNGNFDDFDDLANDDCFNRDDSQSTTSRKRRRVASGDHTTKDQQQHQISSFPEFAQMPPPKEVNINSNTSQGNGIEDGLIPVPDIGVGSFSPSFQSASRSLREGAAAPSLSTRVPMARALLGENIDLVGSATFGQGIFNGSIQPSTIAAITMNDPLQRQLLHSSTSGGTGSNSSNTVGVTMSQSKGASFGIGNSNQLSTLSQQILQQNDTALPSIPTLSDNNSTRFQLGGLPLDSNLNHKKDFLRNIDQSNSEISRNVQLQQQHMAMVSQLNASAPFHYTMYSQERTSAFSKLMSNNDNPFEVPSNSTSMSQGQIGNGLIRSSADVSGLQHPVAGPTTAKRKDTAFDSSLFYDCDNGRSKPLFLPCDARNLSDYQCLLRNQIELFEATSQDLQSSTRGRNKPILLGQVGVRCVHCRNIKPEHRGPGATYYPAKLEAMYQSGQTMAIRHLRDDCLRIPFLVRQGLFILKDGKSSAGGGKKYWSDAASVLGVYASEEGGLRFRDEAPAASTARDPIPPMATTIKPANKHSK